VKCCRARNCVYLRYPSLTLKRKRKISAKLVVFDKNDKQ